MNKYQQEIFNEVKNQLQVNTDNKCFNEKIECLIKVIKDLDLITKYDLLQEDLSVKRISDYSIGLYINLSSRNKLAIIVNENEYIIFYKGNNEDEWKKKYVENNTELTYNIQQFL